MMARAVQAVTGREAVSWRRPVEGRTEMTDQWASRVGHVVHCAFAHRDQSLLGICLRQGRRAAGAHGDELRNEFVFETSNM
jgi:hypothetical protein